MTLRNIALCGLLLAALVAFAAAQAPAAAMPTNPYAADADWWKHAVIYELSLIHI